MKQQKPAALLPLFDSSWVFIAKIDEHRVRALLSEGHAKLIRKGACRREVQLTVSQERAGLVRVIHRQESPGSDRNGSGGDQSTTKLEHLPGVERGFAYIHQHRPHLRKSDFRHPYLSVIRSVITPVTDAPATTKSQPARTAAKESRP